MIALSLKLLLRVSFLLPSYLGYTCLHECTTYPVIIKRLSIIKLLLTIVSIHFIPRKHDISLLYEIGAN